MSFATEQAGSSRLQRLLGDKHRWLRFWIPLLLLALTVSGLLGRLYDGTLGGALIVRNEAQLDSALGTATKLLVTVGVVRGTVDVIEGSSVVGIEFGDIVQPLLDILNTAWDIVFWATLALLACKYLLPVAALMAPWFLAAGLLATLLQQVWGSGPRWSGHALAGLQRLGYGAALLFYFLVPLALLGSGALGRVTATQAEQRYEPALWQLDRTFTMDGIVGAQGVRENVDALRDKGGEILRFMRGGGHQQDH